MLHKVPYVGHLLIADGVEPDPEKTEVVRQMPKPGEKHTLQHFLELKDINHMAVERVCLKTNRRLPLYKW